MATFADRLKELREGAGLTQAQLAEASSLPVGSIRNYEQGQREPYWQVVFRLAAALGVSCEAFAGCVVEPEPARPAKAPRKPAGPEPPPAAKGKGKKGKRKDGGK